jgi:hypothetical protein
VVGLLPVPSGDILNDTAIEHRCGATSDAVTSIVATGAGYVAADFIEGRARISARCVLAVVIPVAVFLGLTYGLSYYLVRRFKGFHAWLLIGTAGVVTVTLVAALSGVDVARCLVTLMLAPAVTVVGSEVRARR